MNISFKMTTAQIRARTKTVTRRMGWKGVKVGQVLTGIEQGQGLKKGEKIVPLCNVRVVDVKMEQLRWMVANPEYGREECRKEGFPELTPQEFIDMFCASHRGCTIDSYPTRIEFEYLEEAPCKRC